MSEIEARLVDLLKDLILVRSTDDNPEGLHHALRLIRSHIEDIPGIRVENHESNGLPSFVALPASVARADVLLVAHTDVVEGPSEHFYPVVEEGRLYGRGAGDMKGQISILVALMRDILTANPDAPLGLMITTDEESGGENGTGYLLEEAGYRCNTAIIPDSGRLNEIVVVEKGLINGRIVSRGRSGHSSRPWNADNAVHRLMENLFNVRAHFEKLAAENHEAHWHPTLSANILHTDNHTHNLIPDMASATVDLRYTEHYTSQAMIDMVRGLLDADTRFEVDITAEPLHTEADPRFLKITEEITGQPAVTKKEHGGSDGRYFTRHGIPVLMSRPEVGGLHSNREWIDIESMGTHYRILDRYLRERFGMEP
ncbi:MAG: M20 family metallopeptidase [Nitrospirota bacterium]|nr:M20 family metallopeptidase [Nitrospirota bacterium]